MAIEITILEVTKTLNDDGEVVSRGVDLVVRNNGGDRYRYFRGGLPATGNLQTHLNGIAQVVWDYALLPNTKAVIISELRWKVFQQRVLVNYFIKIWESLYDDVPSASGVSDLDLVINLVELIDNHAQALAWFIEMKKRRGLAGNTLDAAYVSGLTLPNRALLYDEIKDFVAIGLGMAIVGNFALPDLDE